MPRRDFRPPLISDDDTAWKLFRSVACVAGVLLIGWLAQSEPEPSGYSSSAWVDIPFLSAFHDDTTDSTLAAGPVQSPDPRDPVPSLERLHQAARDHDIPPLLLLEAWLDAEVRHRPETNPSLLLERFWQITQPRASFLDPIDDLAQQKAAVLSQPGMVYKMDAYPLSRALLDDEIQCQSASILVALRWLQSPHTGPWRSSSRLCLQSEPCAARPAL